MKFERIPPQTYVRITMTLKEARTLKREVGGSLRYDGSYEFYQKLKEVTDSE